MSRWLVGSSRISRSVSSSRAFARESFFRWPPDSSPVFWSRSVILKRVSISFYLYLIVPCSDHFHGIGAHFKVLVCLGCILVPEPVQTELIVADGTHKFVIGIKKNMEQPIFRRPLQDSEAGMTIVCLFWKLLIHYRADPFLPAIIFSKLLFRLRSAKSGRFCSPGRCQRWYRWKVPSRRTIYWVVQLKDSSTGMFFWASKIRFIRQRL